MLTEERQLMMWAAAAFASVYLIMVFVAGAFVAHVDLAWRLATFSVGTGYLCTLAKAFETRASLFRLPIARIAFAASLASGAASGMCLL